MELEEMEHLWAEMSVRMETQKKISDSLIIKMTQLNYRNKINKIWIPEAAGYLVCFAELVFIVLNFQKLTTWYLVACGFISALILLILPVLSIRAIRTMLSVNIAANNYKQSLIAYSKGKTQLLFAQKSSFFLGAVLLLVIFPVMGMLIGGKDVFKSIRVWYWYIIVYPFFYAFAGWVFKRYMKMATDAEHILKELEL
ncbi:hypothetical protein [Mucilaginibacter paludis]|uniref:Uncharacterized protein n=1 Tax=Mucilaginibacter paludis DSM 18603 TaxID=714943 RepID=H1YIZ6_9SPHI|nr:hypothetical protein [Mucilaginibacter paludis]EHQ27691.1 hypothetical protein Mucpa_3593 [Mucilaginibacter paludis DSM 18603]